MMCIHHSIGLFFLTPLVFDAILTRFPPTFYNAMLIRPSPPGINVNAVMAIDPSGYELTRLYLQRKFSLSHLRLPFVRLQADVQARATPCLNSIASSPTSASLPPSYFPPLSLTPPRLARMRRAAMEYRKSRPLLSPKRSAKRRPLKTKLARLRKIATDSARVSEEFPHKFH
jgi:hypothetical protein